ncbi:MAG: hypothetical protein ACRDD1_02180, partial [Planctomycetia bacterium]
MPAPEALIDLYLHLASASDHQRLPLQRDKFLVLAGGFAEMGGNPELAERCRLRLLAGNPNHLLKNFESMQEAMQSDDVRFYTKQLLRLYPFEKAEYLLYKFRASGYSGRHEFADVPPHWDDVRPADWLALEDDGEKTDGLPRGCRPPAAPGNSAPRPAADRANDRSDEIGLHDRPTGAAPTDPPAPVDPTAPFSLGRAPRPAGGPGPRATLRRALDAADQSAADKRSADRKAGQPTDKRRTALTPDARRPLLNRWWGAIVVSFAVGAALGGFVAFQLFPWK